MPSYAQYRGVYAAAVTPLHADYSQALDDLPSLLHFLSQRGCHGALLLGTTGEGPSFLADERIAIFKAAQSARQSFPSFRLLAGTGTPSLEETIFLTKAAFDEGLDGAVILPPYYYRKVSDDGLFTWFSQVLQRSVPRGGLVLGYNIPPVTGVGFSLDLLARLMDAFPDRFAGIKDSSGNQEYALQLGARFADELFVLTGNDRLVNLALQNHAAGCLTAMANLTSPALRTLWDAHQAGNPMSILQDLVSKARLLLDKTPPMPAVIKALLATRHNFPAWAVRPPLLPLDDQVVDAMHQEFSAIVD